MTNSERSANFCDPMLALGATLTAKAGDRWSMVGPELELNSAASDRNNPYQLGAWRSWVPTLGEIIWELPEDAGPRSYYAYVCHVTDGQAIGYVRVPSYAYDTAAAQVFEETIERFEKTTDAMIFDQINNNGGSMFQMYALLSRLTDAPLALPQHQITIDDDYAALAADTVARAEMAEEDPFEERPSSERIAYARFVLSEKLAGRGTSQNLSKPVHLEGVSQIVPAQRHYTKRIVVLINALCFSAPEFLAAILQDNRRATLFGERTAGAGGCVRYISMPNSKLGIEGLTLTWTIARRTNGEYIENRGVHPDVRYEITVDDLQHEYRDYRRALLGCLATPP
jgi:hypothetical protein